MQGIRQEPGLSEFDLGYYGWRVVLAACFGVMAGFGSLFVYTFTVFLKPLGAEFGWSREAVSSGFAIAAVTVGLCSPLLGRWIDRFGPRRIILPCMTVFGCGIASLSLLRSGVWQFYVTCFVLGVVGNGAAHLAYSRSISTWFQRRLGLALAFVMVGSGLGAMILPVVAQTIITRSGWRAAYACARLHRLCCLVCRSVGSTSASVTPSGPSPGLSHILERRGSKACALLLSGLSSPSCA